MKFRYAFAAVTLFLSLENPALALGPTYVRDAIAVSAEWTQANSPYVLQNDIVVNKGAILTIDPGVTVQFMAPASGKPGSGPNLVIQGGLRAIGNSVTPISFAPAVAGSLWGALYFANSDSVNSILQGCLVKGGRIIFNGCSPTITQCAIYGSKTGVEVLANSQAQIIGNRITANGVGIALLSDTASPVVSKNDIYNNNFGIYFKDFGMPSISDNRVYNNLKYNMVNYSPKLLAVPNNDFRLADAQQIMRTIYDGAYNPSYGRLNFMPFAGMVSGQTAPAMASSAAASQEQPAIQEEDFWSYGRPFDAMKVSNLDSKKQKPSSAIKILAVGATAVVTVVLLFL
jgi:parallel beta-helix repeat protein